MKQLTTVALLISLSILTFGCEDRRQQETLFNLDLKDRSIRIGVLGPLSGSDKKMGENGLAGIKTALKYYGLDHENSGIKLILEDDQDDPHHARKAFVKLVEAEGVMAILLLSTSEVALELEDLAQKYKVPVFALISTHPKLAGTESYISQLLFDDEAQARVAALYVRDELLIDRAAVIVDNQNPHSLSLATQFIKTFTSTGGFPIEIAYNENRQLFGTRLKALYENGIGFVYVPLEADYLTVIAEQLAEINYEPTLMGGDGLQASLFLNFPDTLQLVDGMLATDSFSSDGKPTTFGRNIKTLFGDSFDLHGTVFTALGVEGTSILLSAISKCGEQTDSNCTHRMLRSVTDFVGLHAKITIRDDGKAERPIFINRVDNGVFRSVVKVY